MTIAETYATALAGFKRPRLPGGMWMMVPFLAFAVLFLLLPTFALLVGAFFDKAGNFTFDNMARLLTPAIIAAFRTSILISVVSSVLGGILGLALAFAIRNDALPRFIRDGLMTLAGVTSNFAGVPLAFAFIATFGRMGLVTLFLADVFGFNLYQSGFTVFGFTGLTLTYTYFQIPLMMLVSLPAVEGLKREWQEAAAMLGATPFQYAFYVAAPILAPAVAGAMLLLFANAFGTVATAFAISGGNINLVTILLFQQIRGDVFHDANLGYALAVGMVLVTGVCNVGYLWLSSISRRRLK